MPKALVLLLGIFLAGCFTSVPASDTFAEVPSPAPPVPDPREPPEPSPSPTVTETPPIPGPSPPPNETSEVSVEEGPPWPDQARYDRPFRTDDYYSHVLAPGPYGILDPVVVDVPVELPTEELGAATDPLDLPRMNLGIWRPDVPEGVHVPVLVDFGPYYDESDVAVDELSQARLMRFLVENYVPHGYAVVFASVFGTGDSNHCMDFMGRSEQTGIDAALTWLGTQPWSTGSIGVIGKSYDGGTAWEAAASGNPHVKTIVPTQGLLGEHDLMWRNGSAEARVFLLQNSPLGYGLYGFDFDPEDTQNVCPDYVAGPGQSAGAYATGDMFLPEYNDFWREREFFERARQNFNGSVFFVHGLQDWNVDNHQAFPSCETLRQDGWEVRGLFGQWPHIYPDRPREHAGMKVGEGLEAYPASVRYDFAQELLEWFDHYLKGVGNRPGLYAEVQDNQGQWRVEETYPPRDAVWVPLSLAEADVGGSGAVVPTSPGAMEVSAPLAWYTFEALGAENGTRIAGMPRFHVTVTPTGPGGQIYAELVDLDPAGAELRLGHAVMDLRYHAGGRTAQTIAPGVPIVAKMEFFAMDVFLPAGHRLELRLSGNGKDYLPAAVSDPVLINEDDSSVLWLPVVDRDGSTFFDPPVWSGDADSVPPGDFE